MTPVNSFRYVDIGTRQVMRAWIGYPLGQPFGTPGDAAARRAGLHPKEPPPIVKLLRRRPWLLARLMSGDIPE